MLLTAKYVFWKFSNWLTSFFKIIMPYFLFQCTCNNNNNLQVLKKPVLVLYICKCIHVPCLLGMGQSFQENYNTITCTMSLDNFFRWITTFIKVRMAFVFGLQPLRLIEFTKIYGLKALELKNKGQKNFYESCDLMNKYIQCHV